MHTSADERRGAECMPKLGAEVQNACMRWGRWYIIHSDAGGQRGAFRRTNLYHVEMSTCCCFCESLCLVLLKGSFGRGLQTSVLWLLALACHAMHKLRKAGAYGIFQYSSG